MIYDPIAFGQKLFKARTDIHLSMSKLGKLVKSSGSTISKMEAGLSTPRVDLFFRLCDILGQDPEYMLGLPHRGVSVTIRPGRGPQQDVKEEAKAIIGMIGEEFYNISKDDDPEQQLQ